MKKIGSLLSLGAVCLVSVPANAYELATHAALTDNAYESSMLGKDTQLLMNLGLDATNPNVFGEVYYDVSGTAIMERRQDVFEQGRMPNEGRDFLTVKGWLMRGAIREDDWTGSNIPGCIRSAENPVVENIDRPQNHFYDQGLSMVLGNGAKSPDWALGSSDAFGQPNTPDTGRDNHYTVFDAREAMYRALTGKKS